MVRDTLQERGPSRDERFVETVQFLAALDAAAGEGELLLIEQLLVDCLDVDARDREGRTLLCLAAGRGNLDAAEFLLRHGANVNARDRASETPLRLALAGGHRALAGVLRRRGGAS